MQQQKIALFEIFLIISLSFSFAGTIGISYGTAPNLKDILNFITIIPTVNAQTTELGCGFSKSEGTCSVNTPKNYCDNEEDCEFIEDDPLCYSPQCQEGCCIIGLNTHWYTQSECQIQSQFRGLDGKFDTSIENEAACFRLSESLEEGACVFNLGDDLNECTFLTQNDCDKTNGIFYRNYLCSNLDLNTRCEKQSYTSCVPSKDEVYWFDSCNNRENIYSSDKTKSWNGGLILSKEESCNPNSDNSNSGSCGNCDYNFGSICGEFRPGQDKGNLDGYTCRNLNCQDENGNQRIHGESWCVYDGTIGTGSLFSGRSGDQSNLLDKVTGEFGLLSTDLVGSRYFRRVCNNGEIEVEPCSDYREEICVQNDRKLENGRTVNDAICRVNLWEQCIEYNQGGECGPACLAKCVNNPDCRIHPTQVDSNFKFTTCVPKYPAGFELGNELNDFAQGQVQSLLEDNLGNLGGIASNVAENIEREGVSSTDICSVGSRTCTSTWVKTCGLTGVQWECIDNCECHSASFSVQMNNLCVSLGDCGVYGNIEGKVTGGIFGGGARITKKGSHGKLPPKPFVLIPVYTTMIKVLKPIVSDGGFFKEEGDLLSLPIGIMDPFLSSYNQLSPDIPTPRGIGGGSLRTQLTYGLVAGGITSVGVSVASLGATSASGIVGGALGVTQFAGGIFAISPLGLTIVAGVIALTAAIGCGKIDTVDVEFQCLPWDRPNGGNDCSKCSEDPLKPCTKYRCESLGNKCTLITSGSGIQECIAIEGEDSVPNINPWNDALNKTLYKYQDVSNNGFRVRTKDGECIPAFTPVVYGVETDVYANCRWAEESFKYEDSSIGNPDVESLVLGRSLFIKNHTLLTYLPSVDSLINVETNPGEVIDNEIENEVTQYLLDEEGGLNIYLKCGNLDGVANTQDYRVNFCVDPGPDVQEPVIVATAPANENITAFSAIEQSATIFVSEPSDCRWDSIKPITSDKLNSFKGLSNEFNCEQGLQKGICVTDESGTTFCGWMCSAVLPINKNENEFFIQCRDQPWLESNNLERNIGNVFEYKLLRSEFELEIDSISPSNEIFAGSEPIVVDLKVKTSGGIDNGKSICEWGFEDGIYQDTFTDTNGKEHHYTLNQMAAGNYKLFIRCKDSAGNVALKSSEFNLNLDTEEPIITRVFGSNGNIMVSTDEVSRCFYNETLTNCGFNSDNSIEFNGANTKILSTTLIEDINYYIMCQDVFGNRPDSCSVVVRSYENI